MILMGGVQRPRTELTPEKTESETRRSSLIVSHHSLALNITNSMFFLHFLLLDSLYTWLYYVCKFVDPAPGLLATETCISRDNTIGDVEQVKRCVLGNILVEDLNWAELTISISQNTSFGFINQSEICILIIYDSRVGLVIQWKQRHTNFKFNSAT